MEPHQRDRQAGLRRWAIVAICLFVLGAMSGVSARASDPPVTDIEQAGATKIAAPGDSKRVKRMLQAG